jgi:adenosylhomocysteine nucleosidase
MLQRHTAKRRAMAALGALLDAVVRAAARFGVPVIGLRGVSDGRTDLSRLEHWTDALAEIDLRLAEALDLLHDHFTPAVTEPA